MNSSLVSSILGLLIMLALPFAHAQESCHLILRDKSRPLEKVNQIAGLSEHHLNLINEWVQLQSELPMARKANPILAKVIENQALQKRLELEKIFGPQLESILNGKRLEEKTTLTESERKRRLEEQDRAREQAEVRMILPPTDLVKESSLTVEGKGKLIALGYSPDGDFFYFKQHWDHVSRKSLVDLARPPEDLSQKQESELWGFALAKSSQALEPLVALREKLEFDGKTIVTPGPNQQLYKGNYDLAHDLLLFSTSEHHGDGVFTYRMFAQNINNKKPARLLYESKRHPDWTLEGDTIHIYEGDGVAKKMSIKNFKLEDLDFPFISSFSRQMLSHKFKKHIIYTTSRYANANLLIFDSNNLKEPSSLWKVEVPGQTPEVILSPNGRYIFIVPRADVTAEILVFDLQSDSFTANLKTETTRVQDAFFTRKGDLALFSELGKLEIYRIESNP